MKKIRGYVTSAIFLMAVSIMFLGLPVKKAQAQQEYTSLNKQAVIKFIEKSSKITSGQNLEMSSDEITDFLKTHLDDRARFKSILKYNIPGFPAQETAMILTKKDFINNVESGSKALENYENRIQVKNVKISKDKTKATVKTTGYETGIMPVSPDGETTQHLPVEGESECNQILMLNKRIIQMYSANCTTTITFSSIP